MKLLPAPAGSSHGGRIMQSKAQELWRTRLELRRSTYRHELVEAPRQAMLDREVQGIEIPAAEAKEPDQPAF